MSRSLEQNFSLKDWVTRRAANLPEAAEDERAAQISAVESFRAVPAIGLAAISETPAIAAPADNIPADSQHDASSLPPSTTQQIQIVRLLRDLGDRLRASEKEREILWKEIESCRRVLTDIEDKTNNTEKAYLTLEHRLSDLPAVDTQDANEDFRKTVSEKLAALETTTGSAVLRLEDAPA
jgi:hypothetical protein